MRYTAKKMGLLGCSLAAVVVAAVTAAAMPALPRIETSFSPGATPHEQILHVEADFGVVDHNLCRILCDLTDYPELHPWIAESYRLSSDPDNGTQDVFVVLDLPWPAGRQWARLEVEAFGGHTLAWRQIEGSFKKLNGTLIVRNQGGHVRLSYWAVIDVGLPNIATRSVMEHFAREFLRAAYEAARQSTVGGTAVPLRMAVGE